MDLSEIKNTRRLSHDASGDNIFFQLKRQLLSIRKKAYTEYIESKEETKDISAVSSVLLLLLANISLTFSTIPMMSVVFFSMTVLAVMVCARSTRVIRLAKKARSSQEEYSSIASDYFSYEDRYLIKGMVNLHFNQYKVSDNFREQFKQRLNLMLDDIHDISQESIRSFLMELRLLEQSIEISDSIDKIKTDVSQTIPDFSGLSNHLSILKDHIEKIIKEISNSSQEENNLVKSYCDFCHERECLSQISTWDKHDSTAVVDEMMRLRKILSLLSKKNVPTISLHESLKRTHFCKDVLNNEIPMEIAVLKDKIKNQLSTLECVYSS